VRTGTQLRLNSVKGEHVCFFQRIFLRFNHSTQWVPDRFHRFLMLN